RQALRDTWVDRYAQFAARCTDAPAVFHRAIGFVVLSTVIGRSAVVHLNTGDEYPVLWLLIIAPSTLYRKSTSLELGRSLLRSVDRELLTPTDVTPQRFIALLAEHDGQALCFMRDEVSGFMESITRLDFMSGFKDLLCQIYDGTPFSREKQKPKQA